MLEDSKVEKADYAGLVTVQGRRRAVILVGSGIDTFSKINYDDARKIAQNAGIPIYIIGTGNLFFKRYGDQLPATDGLTGSPGRMTFLQADNTLKTFAKETGGAYFRTLSKARFQEFCSRSTDCCAASTVSLSIRAMCGTVSSTRSK